RRDILLPGSGQAADLEFVDAVRLSPGEARTWQDAGCSRDNCAHVTFYDYGLGGTVEGVIDLDLSRLISQWSNSSARPAGSTHILPKALSIAAQDQQVKNTLGDIGEAEPAMIPMSGWLADNECSEQWCVDLTFHDPNGSGKVFHVFVNMEQEQVARTFYTRSRPDRLAAEPVTQRNAFSDDCHEEYGWEVCWEMTAHDGVNFQDAVYKDQLVFSSAKIGQVEAWYPSWPGGYRDEIGFSASVPPVGDTIVNDLGNGFEVRQLFTEFTRWPNCICCYRYEQVIQFYEDGQLDFRFVSYGPGCDDLSIYRPFWRIDLDLDGPENDDVWLWNKISWEESLVEFETFPLVKDLSPDGENLATFDGDLHYRWSMERTDPFGLDEGYLFLLQFKENEGEGPIVTGPGDTFMPPRQWIDGDSLSGENIVLWHVPLLKTIKGGPYWCMPDPEPAYSPCDAILRAVPAGELRQPTAEELATATPTAAPDIASDATQIPLLTPTPAPTPTVRPIEGSDPEEIILNAGCGSCHQIGALGESHKVGPDLSRIGTDAVERLPGVSAEVYIRQSILEPNEFLAPECPNGPCMANVMPRDYATRLSEQQIDSIVSYLLDLQEGDEEIAAPGPESAATAEVISKAFPAPKNAKRALAINEPASTRVVQILLLSLVFLLSLLLFFKGKPDEPTET
ncbi:MAG: c-type cytochrome, partial [Candidatus Promineifilaceae bacterium]|nr:c-type cytochrome [Candidatus Promineifilaceae bacterium]